VESKTLYFVQMSGVPGTGKTSIARPLAAALGAVVIDHDITKTALLEAGIPWESAGPGSYTVLGALAADLLAQGHSVVFDSPCAYDIVLERGQKQAASAAAIYRYIECVVEDLKDLDRRLRDRERRPSQIRRVFGPVRDGAGRLHDGEAFFRGGMARTRRPERYLRLDTTRPLEDCVREALDFVLSPDP
jgi:hypothetical protein